MKKLNKFKKLVHLIKSSTEEYFITQALLYNDFDDLIPIYSDITKFVNKLLKVNTEFKKKYIQ